MMEIMQDLKYQNLRNHGRIVHMRSCRLNVMNSMTRELSLRKSIGPEPQSVDAGMLRP